MDPSHGHATTIEHPFDDPYYVAHSSDGTLYVAADGGLHEICSADGVAFRLAPNAELGRTNHSLMSCHLDEPNRLLYVSTKQRLYAVSVLTAGKRRSARIFPVVQIWALTQRGRAEIAPAAEIIDAKETNMRAVLSGIMRLRVVGVLGLVLRFAFD